MFPSTRQGFQFEPFIAEFIPGLKLPTSVNCFAIDLWLLCSGEVWNLFYLSSRNARWRVVHSTRGVLSSVCRSVAEKVGISVPCPTCAVCTGPSRDWTFEFPTGASGWVSEPALGASMLSDLDGGTQADSTCTVLLGACQHLAGQTQGFNLCLLPTFLGRPTSIT